MLTELLAGIDAWGPIKELNLEIEAVERKLEVVSLGFLPSSSPAYLPLILLTPLPRPHHHNSLALLPHSLLPFHHRLGLYEKLL